MRVGIHFVNFTLPGAPASLAPTLVETAQTAEHGGASAFTLMDHWFQMEAFATGRKPSMAARWTSSENAAQPSSITVHSNSRTWASRTVEATPPLVTMPVKKSCSTPHLRSTHSSREAWNAE